MKEYEALQNLCWHLGYQNFTDLQKRAFSDPLIFDDGKNVMVTGSTSTGKTLVPILYYLYMVQEYSEVPGMLYAVPYKALALQKKEEIKVLCEKLDIDVEVIISSGDYRENDNSIICEEQYNRIAVIIYEKIFSFSGIDDTFWGRFHYLVLDEAGIIDSKERGIKADFIIERATRENIKIFALTTPYVDWREYVEKYDFAQIIEKERPVPLEQIKIQYNAQKNGILVNQENPILQNTLQDKRIPVNSIIKQIVKYAINNNMSMIVFKNNRAEVISMVVEVHKLLVEDGLFDPIESGETENIREEIAAASQCPLEDMEGIFADEQQEIEALKAMKHGMAFHSAALPIEFREFVEHNWGVNRAKFCIVFSTETLAFGMNSNADIVVIADMVKPRGGQNSFLTRNEYENYIGRAGRLGKERGYAFSVVRSKREADWKKMKEEDLIISSQFENLDDGEKVFYILNMFDDRERASVSELTKHLGRIPLRDHKVSENEVREYLRMLVKGGFIQYDAIHSQIQGDESYRLLDAGKRIKGYILSFPSYLHLHRVTDHLMSSGAGSNVEFIFRMCGTPDFLLGANHTCGHERGMDRHFYRHKIIGLARQKKYNFVFHREREEYYRSLPDEEEPRLRYTIALAMWCGGEKVGRICEQTNIPYGLLKSIGENMSYYLEIAESISKGYTNGMEMVEYIEKMRVSMYFGIPMSVLAVLDRQEIHPRQRYQYKIMGRILDYFNRTSGEIDLGDYESQLRELGLKTDFEKLSEENRGILIHANKRIWEWL